MNGTVIVFQTTGPIDQVIVATLTETLRFFEYQDFRWFFKRDAGGGERPVAVTRHQVLDRWKSAVVTRSL